MSLKGIEALIKIIIIQEEENTRGMIKLIYWNYDWQLTGSCAGTEIWRYQRGGCERNIGQQRYL